VRRRSPLWGGDPDNLVDGGSREGPPEQSPAEEETNESPQLGAKGSVDAQTLHLYWFRAWTAVMGVNASLSKQLSSLVQSGLVRTAPSGLPGPGDRVDGWQAKWSELAYANSVLSTQLMHFSCSDPSTLFPPAVRSHTRRAPREEKDSPDPKRQGDVPYQAPAVGDPLQASPRSPTEVGSQDAQLTSRSSAGAGPAATPSSAPERSRLANALLVEDTSAGLTLKITNTSGGGGQYGRC
jgi:hypothetical protein